MADRLFPGQRLEIEQFLESENRSFKLILQRDGNLVLQDRGRPIWASNTAGRAVSHAIMQGDVNFVIYAFPQPVWSTGTRGWNNPFLIVQNDGNVVIYGQKATWSTNTARNFYWEQGQ